MPPRDDQLFDDEGRPVQRVKRVAYRPRRPQREGRQPAVLADFDGDHWQRLR